MFLRGRYNYRRQKRWRKKFEKARVLPNFEMLKQSFQSLKELPLKIRMYEVEKNMEKEWHRI